MNIQNINFNSFLATNLIFGINSIESNLSVILKEANYKRVFIATDNGLLTSGIVTRIQNCLSQSSIEFYCYSEVEPNPLAETVM